MTEPAPASDAATITAPFLVIDDFLPTELALKMREDIDAHFARPDKHQPQTHQVWNYWYVPGTYIYLRTNPEKLIDPGTIETFLTALRDWSLATLGLDTVTWPYLSLYIDGCSQMMHNDSLNGRLGYVYSLTRSERRTIGGSTLIMNEGDPFRRNLRNSMTLAGLSHAIEPRFNRLLVFDDRMMHAVERVEGSMDPVEGRFVLHGHIQEGNPVAAGALPYDQIQPIIQQALDGFVSRHGQEAYGHHGPLNVRFTIEPRGTIRDLRVLLDRVVPITEENAAAWSGLRQEYLTALAGMRFPATAAPTTVTFPILYAGPPK